MKKLVASGPVILEKGKLLVIMNDKDNFYKIPGGKLVEGESLEGCAIRELEEEAGLSCKLIKKIDTYEINQKPGTGEKMKIELHHYLAKLTNPVKNYESFNHNGHFVAWIDIGYIRDEKCFVAPNIKFLLEKGVIA